jgi:hypothetical protein
MFSESMGDYQRLPNFHIYSLNKYLARLRPIEDQGLWLVDNKRVLILDKEHICFRLRVRIMVLNLKEGVNGKKSIYLPKSSNLSFTCKFTALRTCDSQVLKDQTRFNNLLTFTFICSKVFFFLPFNQ